MLNPILQAISEILNVTLQDDIGDGSGYYVSTKKSNETLWIGFYRRNSNVLRHLWSLDDSGFPHDDCPTTRTLASCNRIVLIETDHYGHLPTDGLAAHLTALDWAHCISAAFEKLPAVERPPPIDVLDLRNGSSMGDEYEINRSYLPERIRYHAPGRNGWWSSLDAFALSLKCPRPTSAYGAPGNSLWTSNRRWLTSLSLADSREGHHYLNNSLGPIALAVTADDGVRNAVIACTGADVLVRGAMLRAMKWVMDAGQEGTVSTRASIDWSEIYASARYGVERELRILLLDDQAGEGWIPILSDALGLAVIVENETPQRRAEFVRMAARGASDGVPAISLWVATDVNSLVASVENRPFPSKGVPASLRFTQADANDEASFDELLLLDLRLFSSSPTRSASLTRDEVDPELEFFRKVRKSLAASGDRDLLELPESRGHDVRYLVALTWFARLIARIDYTYPVILWSSTGQRRIVDSLKGYPSVYTRLEKPRFGSYGIEGIDLVLSHAIAHQMHVLAASSFIRKQRTNPICSKPFVRVDIYTDESGDKRLELGGFAVVYQANDQAQLEQSVNSFTNSLDSSRIVIRRDDQNVSLPFLWGPSFKRDASSLHERYEWIRKNDVEWSNREGRSNAFKLYRFLRQAAKKCAPGKASIVFFSARAKNQASTPFSLIGLDGRYYSAMPYLLEALVAHVFSSNPATLSIAIRLRTPVRDWPLAAANRDLYEKDWGSEVRNNKYSSVTDQWIHATAWALAERNRLPAGSIHGASAPSLRSFVVDADSVKSQIVEDKLRLCADPVPRFPLPDDLEGVFVDGIDDAFRAVLDFAAMRFDDLGGALAGVERAYHTRRIVALKGSQRSLLGEVVASMLRFTRHNLLADDFHRYVAMRRHST